MTTALVVIAVVGGIAVAFGLVYLCAWAIDKGIKDYIDYARKGKEDERR